MNARRKQRGAFTAPFALMLIPILGVVAMALDLSLAYARRAELQGVADAAALAAARALDGTMAGIALARSNARSSAMANRYQFDRQVDWDDNALRFAASADAPPSDWIGAGSVSAGNVASLRYARIDTAELPGLGTVNVLFAGVLGQDATLETRARATAGRNSIGVLPLGICAIRSQAASSRPNSLGAGNEELLEYGFRRGVSYNLLNLNPHGSSAVNYLINPLDFPAAANHAGHHSTASAHPFICTGTLARPSLPDGATVYVRQPFPPELTDALNARFDQYAAGGCNKTIAPPDLNVRDFSQWYVAWWMSSPAAPARASAAEALVGGALLTLGESPVVLAGSTSASYGPVWTNTKPVRYNGAAADHAGPSYVNADLDKLYPVASGALASNYSNSAQRPYASKGVHRISPADPGLANRRILHIPLLSCPVSGSSATVLAVGRFLMVAPATSAPPAVHAEFSGLASDASFGATAALVK